MGLPGFSDVSLPAGHGLRTPPDLHILAIRRMLLFCLRRTLRPSASGLTFSKLYQHFRERGLPYGVQDYLCTLTSPIVRGHPLLIEINTRYGWVANPYPAGTFTLQDTPSLSRRDNEIANPRRHPPFREAPHAYPASGLATG